MSIPIIQYQSGEAFRSLMEVKRETHQIPQEVLGFFSDESQEVLEHFGPRVIELLNRYSCELEDALIAQVKKNNELMRLQERWEIKQEKSEEKPKKKAKRFNKKRKR